MEDDLPETLSRELYWEASEPASDTVHSKRSFALSEPPTISLRFRNMPSHGSSITSRENTEINPASHVSTIEKAEINTDYHENYKPKICSRTRRLETLLMGSNTEHHYSLLYGCAISTVSEENRAITLEMLRWVTYAARQLYIWELLEAIAFQMGIYLTESDIERICGGFLTTTEEGRVSFVHLNLKDYLLSRQINEDTLGWNKVSGASHEMITTTCLQVLQSRDLQDFSTNTTVESRKIPFHQRWQSLRTYAEQYWRFHYTHAEPHSYCLAGMLHESLKSGWKVGYETFAPGVTQQWTFLNSTNEEFSNSSAMNFFNSVLIEGARSGMGKLVKLELEMGASPNASDSLGMTPLHYAAVNGNCKVIKLLLDYGGISNIISKSGETPLSLAVANRQIEGVKLLQARVSPSADNSSGARQNEDKRDVPQASHQKLSLRLLLKSYCSDCGDIRSHFVLSKMPNKQTYGELWPSIYVVGQSASQAKCVHSVMQKNSQMSYGSVISEQITMVKWFPGISMYTALGIAATHGMDDVLKLLHLAGNDVEALQRNASLNKLMSEMSIS